VPGLIDALKDSEVEVRVSAAVALGGIGEQAKAAASALIDALKDRGVVGNGNYGRGNDHMMHYVSQEAYEALCKIDPSKRAHWRELLPDRFA
jgi:HEAT repeat protein